MKENNIFKVQQDVYMAQIPEDFNGMITFMNINSEQNSQNNDNDDQFKRTGGSTHMRGTMISLKGFNSNT